MSDAGGETPAAAPEKGNVFAEEMGRVTNRTDLTKQPIPESPRQQDPAPPKTTSAPLQRWGSSNETAAALGKATQSEEKPKAVASDPLKALAKTNGVSGQNGASKDTEASKKPETKPATQKQAQALKPTPTLNPKKSNPTLPASKTSTKSPTLPASKTSTKSPTTSKPVSNPVPKANPSSTTKTPGKTPEKKSVPPLAPPTSATGSTQNKPTSSKKMPPPGAVITTGGFVKPKPKSPTRPVRLPDRLVAPTASSVSKVRDPGTITRSASAMGGSGRPHSRASTTAAAFLAAGGSSAPSNAPANKLRRQSSVVGRPRPSVGPPPRPRAADHPPVKHDRHVDESFLARMMRPTMSSEAKFHDKVPVTATTPPRKTAGPPPSAWKGTPTPKRSVSNAGTPTATPRKETSALSTKSAPEKKNVPKFVGRGTVDKAAVKPVEGSGVTAADAAEVTARKATVEEAAAAAETAEVAQPAADTTSATQASVEEKSANPKQETASSPVAELVHEDEAANKAESVSDTTAVEVETEGAKAGAAAVVAAGEEHGVGGGN